LRLGRLFGTGAESWLNLQSLYELRRAEQKAGKTIRALPTLQRRKGGQGRQPAHGVATALTQRGRRRAIEV
jgi:plasmid maintenance system antidote protein VapI